LTFVKNIIRKSKDAEFIVTPSQSYNNNRFSSETDFESNSELSRGNVQMHHSSFAPQFQNHEGNYNNRNNQHLISNSYSFNGQVASNYPRGFHQNHHEEHRSRQSNSSVAIITRDPLRGLPPRHSKATPGAASYQEYNARERRVTTPMELHYMSENSAERRFERGRNPTYHDDEQFDDYNFHD
jgi:hypothetical protein